MEYGDAVFRMGPQHYEKTDEKTIKDYKKKIESAKVSHFYLNNTYF
jgi:hypothetical protein